VCVCVPEEEEDVGRPEEAEAVGHPEEEGVLEPVELKEGWQGPQIVTPPPQSPDDEVVQVGKVARNSTGRHCR
jgi:hypothetical protein